MNENKSKAYLDIAKAFGEFAEDITKRSALEEQKRWKDFKTPSSLKELLSNLRKYELDHIRQKYNLQKLSQLNRTELIDQLTNLLPVSFTISILGYLDQERIDLLNKFVNVEGCILASDLTKLDIRFLTLYGLAFPNYRNEQKSLYMPDEIKKAIKVCTHSGTLEKIKRNTEWLKFVKGALYYCGLLERFSINDLIVKHYGKDFPYTEFWNVINFAIKTFDVSFTLSSRGNYLDGRVSDEKKIIILNSEHNIEYYPFTKEQLLKAGENEYYDHTLEINKLKNFLIKYYQSTEAGIDAFIHDLITRLNHDETIINIVDFIESRLQIPHYDHAKALFTIIEAIHNNTRLWFLKGYTLNELKLKKRLYVKYLVRD